MAKYRKIDPRIWNDAKFGALSDSGKLAFLFLLTHPHMTSLGAMRASLPGLAAELGWESKAFEEAFQEVCVKGMAKHDKKASMVWLPKFIRYNHPESPNVLKAWAAALDLLPECRMKNEVIHSVKELAKGLSKGFSKGLPEEFAKAMPNQEQEQEQEQEVKNTSSPSGDGAEEPPPRKPKPTPKAKNQPSDADLSDAFEVYWAAGMRKIDKKKARKAFDGIVKREGLDPGLFARQLYDDVQARLRANVFGFKQLHPTTYLNGERWNDEIINGNIGGGSLGPLERFEQALKDRDAQSAASGLDMAQDDRDLWGEVDEGGGRDSFIDLDQSDWHERS